jgi:hypothetical protein
VSCHYIGEGWWEREKKKEYEGQRRETKGTYSSSLHAKKLQDALVEVS